MQDVFVQSEEDHTRWKCKYCSCKRIQKCSGYSNIILHVLIKHVRDYKALMENESSLPSKSENVIPKSLFYSQNVVDAHGWLDLVVLALLPFSITENVHFRKAVKYSPISVKALRKYMSFIVSMWCIDDVYSLRPDLTGADPLHA